MLLFIPGAIWSDVTSQCLTIVVVSGDLAKSGHYLFDIVKVESLTFYDTMYCHLGLMSVGMISQYLVKHGVI